MKILLCVFLLCFMVATIRKPMHAQTFHSSPVTEAKIDALISQMTLEEKVGQLNMYSGYTIVTGPLAAGEEGSRKDHFKKGWVGSVLNVVGVKQVREMQKVAVEETRLGIPLLFAFDVIHGYRTIFPIPLAESCSWDLDAIETSARIAAIEATAVGLNWTFAPMVDISRDARWGRVMESAGEDTYWASQVAAARVRGFQGDDLSAPNTLLACAKHLAGYGFVEAGREYNYVDISYLTLHNTVLPPFRAAHAAGVATVMSSFNDFDGIPAVAQPYLSKYLLKEGWGFEGAVVTDWATIRQLLFHGVAADLSEATVMSMDAGTDIDMESKAYFEHLAGAVESGQVDSAQVDDAVRRMLRLKFAAGLFDNPYRYCSETREKELLLSDAHQAAARDVARKSIVLLKNEGNLLPLDSNIRNLAVIGPLADSKVDMNGFWIGQGRAEDAVTLLEGIRGKVSSETKIHYARGCSADSDDRSGFAAAVAAAKQADVVILAVGELGEKSGEGASRVYLDLPGAQADLVKAIHATGKPVVAVLMNGRPLAISWTAENVPAILETWFLGTQAGNAIADVMFGDYNPSGKLTMSFPRTVGQVPIYYNHRSTGRPFDNSRWSTQYIDMPSTPLFPFGHGLSYTRFDYSDITLSSNKLPIRETLSVSVTVTNVGTREGEEVVQLYTQDIVASITRPVKELKGYHKIMIPAGESRVVSFTISPEDLGFYGTDLTYQVEPGVFKVYVGPNSVDVKEAEFKLLK